MRFQWEHTCIYNIMQYFDTKVNRERRTRKTISCELNRNRIVKNNITINDKGIFSFLRKTKLRSLHFFFFFFFFTLFTRFLLIVSYLLFPPLSLKEIDIFQRDLFRLYHISFLIVKWFQWHSSHRSWLQQISLSVSLSGIFPMRAMSTRFLTAWCHGSTLRSFEFRYILPEHVTCSKSRYQVVEFAFIVVLPIAVGLVLLAQRDAVQYPFSRILSLHRSFSKLKLIRAISNTKYE